MKVVVKGINVSVDGLEKKIGDIVEITESHFNANQDKYALATDEELQEVARVVRRRKRV